MADDRTCNQPMQKVAISRYEARRADLGYKCELSAVSPELSSSPELRLNDLHLVGLSACNQRTPSRKGAEIAKNEFRRHVRGSIR